MKSILLLSMVLLGGCATPAPPDTSATSNGNIGDVGGYCENACVRGLVCSNHTCIRPY